MPDPSPFTSLVRHGPTQVSTKRALVSLSRSIEARALAAGSAAQLFVCLQHVQFHQGRTRALHHRLARAGVEVHVYGVDVRDGVAAPPELSAHNVSGFGLLAQEWNVLLVTPRSGLGLWARQVDPVPGPTAPVNDLDRRFEWLVSENRANVVYAAAALSAADFVVGGDFSRR